MPKHTSPKQVARAIGVSESTLKRWCDSGLISMTKTAGGHRRIEIEAVIRFLRQNGRELVEPELLGLPVTAGKTAWTLNRATDRLIAALIAGEEAVVRQLVFDLLLANHSPTAIADDVVTPAMHRIGEQWSCGDVAIYQERRACEICIRVIHELQQSSTCRQAQSPEAIGGTIEADFYTIPVALAETVLTSVGWHATTLGTNLPFNTLCQALEMSRPRLIWLSVSHIADNEQFVAGVNQLFQTALESATALAIGGQAVSEPLRRQIQYTVFCETFRDLERFARSLHPVPGTPTPPPVDASDS
tara:strand:+ start:130686 stop:131591 length:906 start_codon:yes stop_codon:yes gene_type:complete